MATNFGFMPVLEGKRYFISYKSEDSERVGAITRRLNEMGVPMWYDYGIEKGELWEKEINRNIKASEAVIIFATKALFAANDTWVRIEFDVAKMYGKKRYVVWLDALDPYEHPEDVHDDLKIWYWNVARLQGIKVAGCSVDRITQTMVTEFHLIQGMPPQPPSPTIQPTEAKAEPKPEPEPVPVPQSVGQTKPSAETPVRKDNPPKQVKTKPAATKSVGFKHTPLIVTVALVLVVAIVGGIWAVGNAISVKPLSELDSVSVGDHFTFGNYKQGTDDERRPIEWRVLAVEDGKALVISEKLLNYVQYTETNTDVTWETCTLRQWMNNDFLNEAFSTSEQAKIATVTNQNPDNPQYGTSGGNATQDKIFALSIEEAETYFSSYSDRKAYTTDYAHAKGYDYWNRSGWWWLRSPGHYSYYAAYVSNFGNFSRDGINVNFYKVAVRPAFWLNL